jgi:hypothetical protein
MRRTGRRCASGSWDSGIRPFTRATIRNFRSAWENWSVSRTLLDRANDAIFLVSLGTGASAMPTPPPAVTDCFWARRIFNCSAFPCKTFSSAERRGSRHGPHSCASAFDSGEEGRCVLDLFTDEGLRRCELSVSVPETSEDAHAVLILRDVEDRSLRRTGSGRPCTRWRRPARARCPSRRPSWS